MCVLNCSCCECLVPALLLLYRDGDSPILLEPEALNQPFLLQVSSVVLFDHSNRKVTNTSTAQPQWLPV